MASPLSVSKSGVLNCATPSTDRHLDKFQIQPPTSRMASERVTTDSDLTSPSVPIRGNEEKDNVGRNQENISPSKSRHSRILSGTELSPLKILTAKDDIIDAETYSPRRQASPAKSTRKMFPEKRFPVKINTPSPSSSPVSTPTPVTAPAPVPAVAAAPTPIKTTATAPVEDTQTPRVNPHTITLEQALRQNVGLANAIKIFEDEETMMDDTEDNDADATSMTIDDEHLAEEEPSGPDDTMISTFSTFSAVPNLTMFAKIGHSPTKFANTSATPTAARGRRELSPERTPRPPVMHESGNTTNLLMDFTEQINGFSSRHPEQILSRHQASGRAMRNSIAGTPQRTQSNLLDFDIPPLPTPRSIPTVTPRELESLKSAFLSEISSLKASLSGKEAEALSLKTAVGDAEKRVGECMEQLREIRSEREGLVEERDSWEKRGRDMETVLRKVKDEIVMSQREREELEFKLDESEKRREAAEIMAQEAESKMAGMRAGKATSDAASDPGGNKSPADKKNAGSREVEIAVERVARELHALYKTKHENKVASLKKSYESRWEKKVRELESRIEDLADENERLKLGRDATITRFDPNQSIVDEERKAQAVKDSAQIKQLNAEIEKLEAVVNSVKVDNGELRHLLEKERVEKGELVMLAEEMMSMQSLVQTQDKTAPTATATTPSRPTVTKPRAQSHQAPQTHQTHHSGPESFRNSIGARPSGLRAPGSVKKPMESRIGGIAHDRVKNGGGIPRPGSGLSTRSGIMSSIEKMGNYRGRGE